MGLDVVATAITAKGGTMKATEAQQYLGKQGKLAVENGKLIINVTCEDIRQVYGRVDVLVISDGSGKAWISEERIQWAS